ncbi:MAG: RNA methyltransferase [Sphingobacteriales bacterium]|nr:RNA methyltransferase [Sphingobacteriales bacterium]
MPSLPEPFLKSLEGIPGYHREHLLATHESGERLTSVRLNPKKYFNPNVASWQEEKLIPWCNQGRYLIDRPSFTTDPLFHAGAYYVQEASSMFLEMAVQQSCDLNTSLRVLDLCAAPGGKSTHLLSLLSPDSLLVSNEVIRQRVNVLAENISKWGAASAVITHNDPAHFKRLPDFFDLIVVDAPCSGSGLFRKDPLAIESWSLANVALCSQRQQRILADVMDSLKPGGILIYSTCSYSVEEDENNADWLLQEMQMEPIKLSVPQNAGIVETASPRSHAPGYRFFPDKVAGEGFYLAAFKKKGMAKRADVMQVTKDWQTVSKQAIGILQKWVQPNENISFISWESQLLAVPTTQLNAIQQLQKHLYIRKAGTLAGSIIRDEWIPDHDMAMNPQIEIDMPKISLNKSDALQYLRRNIFEIDTQLKGWVLVQFEGINLGWIKLLPGRINNYYPKDWRILNK